MGAPPRPLSKEPDHLGFTPQPMVRWLSPGALVDTAVRVVLSGIFGSYADKRETQAALVQADPMDYSGRAEMWLDYAADLGDGFDPTYTVASLLAEPKLDLARPGGPSVPSERGSVLVMGGDQVYPAANRDAYRDRCVGPYRAALPYTASDHPHLYAIPGNHDWYDGLTSFMRVFCQRQWVGGWQTQQSRSYFALRLPHRWWLWGIDIQFDTYIDEPQFSYFEQLGRERLERGDSVILCSAKPSWVEANEDLPDAFGTLDYFERKIIRPRGATMRLALTGDSHHYAHYVDGAGACHKVTAGGGGAFLSATHHLPATLALPPAGARDPGKTVPPADYHLVTTFPTKKESRGLRRGIVALPVRNPSFWALVGAVYLLYAWMIQSSISDGSRPFADVLRGASFGDLASGTVRSPLALVVTAVLVRGLVGFTKAKDRRRAWAIGGAHAAVQLLAIVAAIWVLVSVLDDLSGAAFTAAFLVALGVIGGLLGSLVMAAYLFVADTMGGNANELFAAQRIEHFKNFLRIHIGADGVLTVHAVGVRKVNGSWRLKSGGQAEDPWLEPTDPAAAPSPHLIEEPFRIDPRAAVS